MGPIGDRRVVEFLVERGAATLAHPGGTLYEHLVRVAGLLADWGAGRALQVAGLCHACYGTDGFGPALVDPHDRTVLRALVGEDAESPVYLYGRCDRNAVYPLLGRPGPVRFRDRFSGRIRSLSEPEAQAFVELTAANELDVVRHSADAAKHGSSLLWLFAAARPRLSKSAWDAWSAQPRHQTSDQPHQRVPDDRSGQQLDVTDLDHLVLTVSDIDETIDFDQRVLGMSAVTFAPRRLAPAFGRHKINLHVAGHEIEPHAVRPAPGSADLCLLTSAPPEQVVAHLRAEQVDIESGPVPRTGAQGVIRSVYVRDPDGNLVEISSYPPEQIAWQAS